MLEERGTIGCPQLRGVGHDIFPVQAMPATHREPFVTHGHGCSGRDVTVGWFGSAACSSGGSRSRLAGLWRVVHVGWLAPVIWNNPLYRILARAAKASPGEARSTVGSLLKGSGRS